VISLEIVFYSYLLTVTADPVSGCRRSVKLSAMRARFRNVIFTVNNPNFDEGELDPELWPDCSFLIYQIEIGEDGTQHYQGYCEFTKQKDLSWLKKLVGLERAHFEKRQGTQKQAIDYCSKADTRVDGPYRWGEPGEQGKRTDLEEVKLKLKAGASMTEIADNHFRDWCKFNKAFKEYQSMCMEKRSWAMDLVLLIGPSRTGKTRTAMEMAGESVYVKPPGKWWDGYNGEHTVVWDEFYGHSYPFTELLRVLDRYPLQVEFKGGFHQFSSRRIIFTSNQEPKDWYNGERTHQLRWEDNPLNARIREFGRILRTGEIHVVPAISGFNEETGLWDE